MTSLKVFAGVLLEWIGPEACVENIPAPTMAHLHLIEMATTKQIIRYFVRDQELLKCNTTDHIFLGEIHTHRVAYRLCCAFNEVCVTLTVHFHAFI